MRFLTRLAGRLLRYFSVAVLGFVVGGLAIYIGLMRSGPPLQLWHTKKLTAEFTAERSDEIRTFEDYQRLEDALFSEADEEIVARTETGPAFGLARYSAGSMADPRRWETNWNRSFELPAQAPAGGVLLLHGMSDSPYSLKALGQRLNAHGYWVVGLRLPGHGAAPSGLKYVTWTDMAAAVRLGMTHLAEKIGPATLHIIGYSTGAPLALNSALDALDGTASPRPASLIFISPAIGVHRAAALASWMGKLAVVPGLEKLAWTAILPEFDPFNFNSFTTNAGDQVHRLTQAVARRVAARAESEPIADFPPTLVILSTVDHTVSTDAVIDNLLEHLAPPRHELLLFDINRNSVKSTILVSDPAPLTARLMSDRNLPFGLTLVTNQDPGSASVVSHRKAPLSTQVSTEPLNLAWPRGVISLSHIALPFPPDDPLYGQSEPENTDTVFLGSLHIRGERGLLQFSSDWLVRLRHNPFFDFVQWRVLDWVDSASGRATR